MRGLPDSFRCIAPARPVTDPVPSSSTRMTPAERRASASLAMIYAARMLGFFLVLPVFALEAARYPGGDNPALVGLGGGHVRPAPGLVAAPLRPRPPPPGAKAGDRGRPAGVRR